MCRGRNQTNSRVAIATATENFQTGGAGTWYSVSVFGMSLKLSKFTQTFASAVLVKLNTCINIFPSFVVTH